MVISTARAIKHPRSIAIVNYKGGVGKTTIAYLLGLYLSLLTARRTLLIDIDAQCSLTIAVGLDPEYQNLVGQNVYNLVTPTAWPSIHNQSIDKHIRAVPGLPAPLYILPGGFNVEDLDIEIVEAIASQRERSKNEFFLYCRQLVMGLEGYEYVLIDCPPNKMYLTQSMLRASSYFVPVTIPDRISIYGMPRLLRWVNEIEDTERPRMLGYILNAVNRIGGSPAGMVISQQAAANELRNNIPLEPEIEKLLRLYFSESVVQELTSLGGVLSINVVPAKPKKNKESPIDNKFVEFLKSFQGKERELRDRLDPLSTGQLANIARQLKIPTRSRTNSSELIDAIVSYALSSRKWTGISGTQPALGE